MGRFRALTSHDFRLLAGLYFALLSKLRSPRSEVTVIERNAPGEIHGWSVTGEPPRITAHPSINAVGDYHGWLVDGVLSDDVEGRTYPATSAETRTGA